MTDFDKPEIYRSVLEALPTGVYLVDRHRRIVFWNSGAERICGYLRQDVVGRFLREHLYATYEGVETGGEEWDPLNQVLRDGKSSTVRVSILHKDGYRVPIILKTVPIRNDRGEIVGAAECFDDNAASAGKSRRKQAFGRLICLDEITGLPSKISMETHLRERIAQVAERHGDFSITLVAVDQLDQITAARGQGVIHSILRVVAHTVENSLRPRDTAGAWGGNRFMVALPDCREENLESVASRLRRMISQSEVEWWGDRFAVTVSLGGASCRPDDTLESLVERAEKGLVVSAAAGGNQVTVVGLSRGRGEEDRDGCLQS